MWYTEDLTVDECGNSIYPLDETTLNMLYGKPYFVLAYSEDVHDVYYQWYIQITDIFTDGTFEWYGIPAYYVDTDFTEENPEDIFYLPQESFDSRVSSVHEWKIYQPLELLSKDELWEIIDANTLVISQLPDIEDI